MGSTTGDDDEALVGEASDVQLRVDVHSDL